MKCLVWNTEWASQKSVRGKHIIHTMEEISPDVACLTEMKSGLFPSTGHIIKAESDYGYNSNSDRRKVALWSRIPWEQVDSETDSELPTGRFISGVTQGTRFIGVCIPWRDAHVRTGWKDRSLWEDHLQYLKALKPIVERYNAAPEPLCILGDYNQRIPRTEKPVEVTEALRFVLDTNMDVATAGISDAEGKALIDHIATTPPLSLDVDKIIPKVTDVGLRLSDHVGIVASIKRQTRPVPIK